MFPTTDSPMPFLTLYYPASQTIWTIGNGGGLRAVTTQVESNYDVASVTLPADFLLYLTVTPTNPPAAVNIDDMVSTLGSGRSAGQTGIPAYRVGIMGNVDIISQTTSTHYTLQSGDTLFIPFTARLFRQEGLVSRFSGLSAVSQTPVTATSTTALSVPMTPPPAATYMPGGTTTPAITTSPSPKHNHTGAIAGGVVGGVVGIALILTGAWLLLRRRRRFQREAEATPYLSQTNEIRGKGFR